MVFFNYSTMQMAAKVVYYGPGLCGKTTNLHFIYSQTSGDSRGEMVSLETETDRTLFFDLLPIDVGTIGGFSTRIQLYTVPGQVFYNTTRKLVLKGVDGVVFVADSQKPMLQANVDSLKNLEENLAGMGIELGELPMVLQYNKRDLPSICSVEELNSALNPSGKRPYFEASALNGNGVFETLKGISRLTLLSLKKKLARDAADRSKGPKAPAQPAAPDSAKAPPPPASAKPAAPAPPAQSAAPPAASQSAGQPARGPSAEGPAAGDKPAAKKPPAAKSTGPKARKSVDVLGELEKLRREVKGRRPARPAARGGSRPGANGGGELSREIQMTINRDDFHRLRRFSLNLQVEDENNQVVDAVRDFHVDIRDPASLEKVLLRLSIALNPKGPANPGGE